MQQMEGKWSHWWRQSTDMCDNLQQQMALLTAQQEATAQRLDHLHYQVITLTPLSHPCLALPHSCLTPVSPLSQPPGSPLTRSCLTFVSPCLTPASPLPRPFVTPVSHNSPLSRPSFTPVPLLALPLSHPHVALGPPLAHPWPILVRPLSHRRLAVGSL